MEEKIISKVKEAKSGQRRITVPSTDETLKDNDLVEIKKLEIK